MILSFLSVILTFGLVIFLHEAGHFFVCRRLGVRVERFAFGFGPELLGITSGGTRFSLCLVPLGGFVKPAGESLEDHTGHPDEYFSRSPWERLAIVAAGPVMNYVLAFVVFFLLVFCWGVPEQSTEAVIGEMLPNYPAVTAGLKPGDRVLKVDGLTVKGWADMAEYVHRNAEKPIAVVYARDGAVMSLSVTPRMDAALRHGVIGIGPTTQFKKVGFAASARESLHLCWRWTKYTVTTLAEKLYKRERPDLAGPVGIVQMVSKAAHSGLQDLMLIIGLISVAIGFFNILPIPLLDGGHAVLYLWEGVTKRKLTVQIVATANSLGLAFLMSLLVFATYNDIVRIKDGRKAAREAAAQKAAQPAPVAPAPK